MKDFRALDPVALRAFYFAAEESHFTKAAEKAGLTQSGVSQHVATLEKELQVSLFVRTGRKVLLTDAGKTLRRYVEALSDQTDRLWEAVRSEATGVSGRVSYAMPESCLMTPHFPLLLKKRRDFPRIDLRVEICHSEEVHRRLLQNEIDFGFVTVDFSSRDIHSEEFAREKYVLVANDHALLEFRDLQEFQSRPLVVYPGMATLFERWGRSYFPGRRPLTVLDFPIAGEINHLEGARTMVLGGVGLSVFPRHCVDSYLKSGELHEFRKAGAKGSEYPIYLVTKRNHPITRRVETVLSAFREMKKA